MKPFPAVLKKDWPTQEEADRLIREPGISVRIVDTGRDPWRYHGTLWMQRPPDDDGPGEMGDVGIVADTQVEAIRHLASIIKATRALHPGD